jgi:16S rRNA (guanine527-N7)-methyltransferase
MFAETLKARLKGVLPVAPDQIGALGRHYDLMVRWNRVLNLTAVRDIEEAVERHYCESLFLGARLPQGSLKVADIGSGAGFPGFPIAVLRGDCEVTLIEAHRRKAVFLREATRQMGNVRVLDRRAEDVAERFDWVVSRAVDVSSMQLLLAVLAPHVALLGGERVPEQSGEGQLAGLWKWEQPVRLPWGDRRWLWIGAGVSRETGSV